jgi:hypothetical protein
MPLPVAWGTRLVLSVMQRLRLVRVLQKVLQQQGKPLPKLPLLLPMSRLLQELLQRLLQRLWGEQLLMPHSLLYRVLFARHFTALI